jgi:hypothetical protein
MFILISCSGAPNDTSIIEDPTDPLILKDRIDPLVKIIKDQSALLDAELTASPMSSPYDIFKKYLAQVKAGDSLTFLIYLFSDLKHHYSCLQTFLATNPDGQHSSEISLMHLILMEYCQNCKRFYSESPREFLLTVRLERNFELAYLFLFYILVKTDVSFDILKKPLDLILEYNDPVKSFKCLKYEISECYGLIAKKVLHTPFQYTDQTQKTDTGDLNSYSCIVDWKERQGILDEIVNSLKDLSEMAKEMGGRNKFRWGKIAKYEFIIKEFQVESKGPSFGHCEQIFRQLQNQINRADLNEAISPITKRLLTLFKIYCIHLYRWQFIDPSLFPVRMLAIISHQKFTKEELIKLFKLSIDELLQESIKSLELFQIKEIISKITNLETNFIPAKSHDLSFRRVIWNHLINLEDVLTPFGKWIVKVYLALTKY